MPESQQDGQGMRRVDDGGRRYVALLFADLCDSTALGEAIDLEETVSLRQQVEDITLPCAVRSRYYLTLLPMS